MLQSHKFKPMGPRQKCHVAAAGNLPRFNLVGLSLVHICLFVWLPPPGPQEASSGGEMQKGARSPELHRAELPTSCGGQDIGPMTVALGVIP